MTSNPALFIDLAVVLVLLAASALVSGAEVAFFSLNPNDIESIKQKKGKRYKQILLLISKPEDLLATLLVSNNLLNIGIVILSTWFTSEALSFNDHPVLTFIIQIVLITFLILLVAEVLPKVYSTRHALRVARFMALPLSTLEKILRPVNRILIGSTSLVRKRMWEQPDPLTLNELSDALDLTGEDLVEEEKILKGIVRFGNIEVKEIMKPRVDIVSVDIESPFRSVFNRMVELGYSRVPVYNSDLDDIRGILYLKDLLPHIKKPDTFRWQSLMRPPIFVPENKKINDLLEEFRKNKMHLALIVDEYGGTSGLVTMEDILEEIVGEIRDESDDEEYLFQRISDDSFLFNGKTLLNDLLKILSLEEDFFDEVKGGADTLAGLILELKGEIPETGEEITLNHLTFVVKNRDDRRIKEIQVTISHPANEIPGS